MQEFAKYSVAIIRILNCIEYVQMPKIVNKCRRNQGFNRVFLTQKKISLIFLGYFLCKRQAPAIPFFFIKSLYLYRFKVEIKRTLELHLHCCRFLT